MGERGETLWDKEQLWPRSWLTLREKPQGHGFPLCGTERSKARAQVWPSGLSCLVLQLSPVTLLRLGSVMSCVRASDSHLHHRESRHSDQGDV